jgi:hypothetical protein
MEGCENMRIVHPCYGKFIHILSLLSGWLLERSKHRAIFFVPYSWMFEFGLRRNRSAMEAAGGGDDSAVIYPDSFPSEATTLVAQSGRSD